MNVKYDLLQVVERNQAKLDAAEAYEPMLAGNRQPSMIPAYFHDVRCGQWYDVSVSSDGIMLEKRSDLLRHAEVHVCEFDIETFKLPLKFPDSEYDMGMMISYMVDGQGYLIIIRECAEEDIEDLECTPKPEFEGYFKVQNMRNEEELLRHWFAYMQEVKPGMYVTYNGNFFDWPFVESRAAHQGITMRDVPSPHLLLYFVIQAS
ncbi:DNA-directed DNA polymerase, family B, exonuclease domain [Dillenia turbinata]|uniref:DNA polymerase epsilon catalytic subunit n=1 Tax=Dillenia turbinata TaxID=194707 RepID=A0AAN8V333_9MAGN